MLWAPSFVGMIGARRPADATMPVIGSPLFGVDTSQRSTIFSDVGGLTPAADSALVARINDAFASTTVFFEQDIPSSSAQLVPSVANGKAALRFAQGGAIKWMYATGGPAPTPPFQTKSFTAAISYRRASATEYGGIFTAGNVTGGNNGLGYDKLLFEGGIAPQGGIAVSRAGGSDVVTVRPANQTYANNQVTKVVVRSDTTNGIEVRSRSASGSFTGTGALPATADLYTWDWVLLGAELGSNGQGFPRYPFDGDLFEFRFWGQRATNAQFDQMQAYLDLKYGS